MTKRDIGVIVGLIVSGFGLILINIAALSKRTWESGCFLVGTELLILGFVVVMMINEFVEPNK